MNERSMDEIIQVYIHLWAMIFVDMAMFLVYSLREFLIKFDNSVSRYLHFIEIQNNSGCDKI